MKPYLMEYVQCTETRKVTLSNWQKYSLRLLSTLSATPRRQRLLRGNWTPTFEQCSWISGGVFFHGLRSVGSWFVCLNGPNPSSVDMTPYRNAASKSVFQSQNNKRVFRSNMKRSKIVHPFGFISSSFSLPLAFKEVIILQFQGKHNWTHCICPSIQS